MNVAIFCRRPLRGRGWDRGVTDPAYNRKSGGIQINDPIFCRRSL